MDYFIVTAVSEERNVSCDVTSDQFTHNCILPDTSVNDYSFTVYSVTSGIDGAQYGSIVSDCCKFNMECMMN